MHHLLTSGPFGMVLKYFQDCFHPEGLVSGFPQLFQLCSHFIKSHIPLQIAFYS
jgi:hypothetical protein